MSGPEVRIERRAAQLALDRDGVQSLKLTPAQSTGWPDRLFLIPGGRPLLIEFKAPGGKLSAKQEFHIGLLTKLGYDVQVHDDSEKAAAAVHCALFEREP